MRWIVLIAVLSLAGCSTTGLTTVQKVELSCVGLSAGAEVAVAITSDLAGKNDVANSTKVSKAVNTACGVIVPAVNAASAVAK
jgi:lipoprotein NlpI